MGRLKRSPIWDDPRVKPPFGAAQINWGHPLAGNNLVHCFLLNEAAGAIHDIAGSRRRVTATMNGPTWVETRGGRGLNFVRASSQWVDLGPMPATGPYTDDVTVVVRFVPTNTALTNISTMLGTGTSDNFSKEFTLWTGNTPNTAEFRWGDIDAVTGIETLTTLTAGVQYDVAGWRQGSPSDWRRRIYLNGRQDNASTIATNISQGGSLALGRDGAGGARYFDGQIIFAIVYDRALSDIEIHSLYVEPYAFLQPVIRRRYFVPVAAGQRSQVILVTAGV